jgi:hypothetical protein
VIPIKNLIRINRTLVEKFCSVEIISSNLTRQGLRPEEFFEFFWKDFSLMRRFFPRR